MTTVVVGSRPVIFVVSVCMSVLYPQAHSIGGMEGGKSVNKKYKDGEKTELFAKLKSLIIESINFLPKPPMCTSRLKTKPDINLWG